MVFGSQSLVSTSKATIVHFVQLLVTSQGSPVQHQPVSSDDIRIYDRPLTTEEVQKLYNLGEAHHLSNIHGDMINWRFTQGATVSK